MLARLENSDAHPMPRRSTRRMGWRHLPLPMRPRAPTAALVPLVALLTLAAFVGLSACATDPAAGPAFAAAPEPSPGRTRLYVFRIDPHRSLSTVELAIDRQSKGNLRHGEYATFELAPGIHRLDLRQRGLAFVSWGWNGEQLRAQAGETIYLEVSVRMSAQPMPGTGREMEIAGRGSGAASENVFLQHRSRAEALERLSGTTLRVE